MRFPAFPELGWRVGQVESSRSQRSRRLQARSPGSALAAFVGLPWLLQLGLLLFGLGLAGDLAYHLMPQALAARLGWGIGLHADDPHLAIFAGMVVIVAGVLRRGLRHGR
jgi:hypothetical protein